VETAQARLKVILTLACDAWHLLATAQARTVTEHALVLLRERRPLAMRIGSGGVAGGGEERLQGPDELE